MHEAQEEPVPIQQEVRGNYTATSVSGNASVQIGELHWHEPPLPSDLPEQVWMVPYRRNSLFTGRETLLTALYERFSTNRTAVLTQGQAISGLGGIGKTQVAVEYAYRHREVYRFVLWANASSAETLMASYVSVADQLHLPERAAKEQDKIVTAVLQWLATHEDWLLIVDNADDLERVWPHLPVGSTGHMLLTTRDQLVGDMQPFQVQKMDQEEGTLLLLRRARLLKAGMTVKQIAQADRQVAEQIVTAIDGLPLAVDQAGAYIDETQCGLVVYLQRYRTHRAVLLGRRGYSSRDYPSSVMTTWSLSFQQVQQRSMAATDLLRVCAYLSPDAIPEAIIIEGARHLGDHLQAVGDDQESLDEAISILRTYSLIQRDLENHTLSVHRLVQIVIQESMLAEAAMLWKQRVVSAVATASPEIQDVEQWDACEQWLPHALVGATWIQQEQIGGVESACLLNQAGCYLNARGHYQKAEPLYQCALSIYEQQLGSQHPNAASTLNNLATLYFHQGKYVEAEPLYQRALSIYEQQLEPPNPNTAQSLNNLALLYFHQGKYVEAEPLYRRALAIREYLLGAQHPDTAQSLNNLARLYYQQEKYIEAEPLYRRALAITEQQLGPQHPDTASTLNNLAMLYHQQRRYAEAEPLYQRALSICESLLGPQHPNTTSTLNNLAMLYFYQEKDAEAESLYRHALTITEQQLGPLHPNTATTLNNLAMLYSHQGKYVEAEPLYRRALAIREQLLGPLHPDTITSMNNLAMLYQEQGKYEQTEPLLVQVLAIREQQLGPLHPHTATSLNNLASLYKLQGKYTQAEPLYRRALEICQQRSRSP